MTGRTLLTIEGTDPDPDPIESDGALFSPSFADIVLTGSRGLRIHDAATGLVKRRLLLPAPDREPATRATVDDRLPTWFMPGNDAVASLRLLKGKAQFFVIAYADGRLLASREWDYSGPTATRPHDVRATVRATDGAITIALDEHIEVWDATLTSLLAEVQAPFSIGAMAWSPDGLTLAAATVNGNVVLYRDNLASAAPLNAGHERTHAVAWTTDSGRLFSSGEEGLVKVWDPVTLRPVLTLRTAEPAVSLALDADGNLFAAEQGARSPVIAGRASVRRSLSR
jgi:WD40 repeat protein